MSATPDDSKRCPECGSSNIALESTGEIRAKREKGSDAEPPVVARQLSVRCRRCKADWTILRRVTG